MLWWILVTLVVLFVAAVPFVILSVFLSGSTIYQTTGLPAIAFAVLITAGISRIVARTSRGLGVLLLVINLAQCVAGAKAASIHANMGASGGGSLLAPIMMLALCILMVYGIHRARLDDEA